MHVGLTTTACKATLIRRRGCSRVGKNEPVRVLAIFTDRSPEVVETTFVGLPLPCVVRVSFCSCMPAPDVLGGLRVNERLEDRLEQGAHQLAVIGGAHRLGRAGQNWFRVIAWSFFREFFGRNLTKTRAVAPSRRRPTRPPPSGTGSTPLDGTQSGGQVPCSDVDLLRDSLRVAQTMRSGLLGSRSPPGAGVVSICSKVGAGGLSWAIEPSER